MMSDEVFFVLEFLDLARTDRQLEAAHLHEVAKYLDSDEYQDES
jgi:hypothetical protein